MYEYHDLLLIFASQGSLLNPRSGWREATYVASTAPGLTTTSILYLDPVSSLMVRVCPNRAPSDLKYTALLLGSIFSEIPILTIWGTSAMFPYSYYVSGPSGGCASGVDLCKQAGGKMPCGEDQRITHSTQSCASLRNPEQPALQA